MTHIYKRCFLVCAATLITFLSFSSASAQWTKISDGLPAGLIYQSQQCAVGEKLYIFGGIYDNTTSNRAWVFDTKNPTDGWKSIANMPGARAGGYAASVDGKVYIMAGYLISNNARVEQSTVLEYNPTSNEYTEKAEIINTVYQVAGAVVGKKIFILNGISGTTYTKQAQVYDVEKDTWDELGGTMYISGYATASAIDNTIYLMGGYTGSAFSNATYKGVIGTNNVIEWTKIANIPVALAAPISGTDGTSLYLVGGQSANGNPTKAYKYDMGTNKWLTTFLIPNPASMNATMPNIGNKLYLISGVDNPFTYEYFDGPAKPVFNISTNRLDYILKSGNEKTFNFIITNGGTESLTGNITVSTDAKWLSVNSSSYNISAGNTRTIDVTANSVGMSQGEYNAIITITSNDPNVASTTINVSMNLIDNPYKRVPVIEVFTSSTCPPCKPGNEIVHNVLEDFTPDQYTMIKFQEYFPGTGDPYTTLETMERGALYQINNGIPFVAVDGKWIGNPNSSFNSDVLTSAADEVAVAQLVSAYSVTDNKVNINVDIESLVNLQTDNLRLHVAIAEKETSKNRKNNGETVFYHVVKKMLPDAKGTAISGLTKNEKVSKSFEFEFPGNYRLPSNGQTTSIIKLDSEHSVEEFSDLEVIAWLEDVSTGLAFNSSAASSVSSIDEMPDNSGLSFIEVYPNPTAGMTTFRFKAEKAMNVTLELFDLAGNKVASLFNAAVAPGEYPVMFDMGTLPTGQYNMWLKTNDKFIGRTITVTK